jgi:hypothetical protein
MLHSMETPSPSPAAQTDGTTASRRGDRALPLVLLVVAAVFGALLAAFSGAKTSPSGDRESSTGGPAAVAGESQSANWTPAPRPTGKTVTLTIDFGNGARREFDDLPWAPGLTLGKLMEEAREFRPAINFAQQGTGKMAFLSSLEGVANESGADGRYWLYSVDGRHGDVSFAVQPLEAGAAVLWEFRRGD